MSESTKCWICGGPAKSYEHSIKRSDFRSVFPEVAQESSVFISYSEEKRNIPIGSSNNDRLKFDAPICSACNNTLTQPHDLAWENLSKKLCETIASAGRAFGSKTIDIVDLSKDELLNVHLYFVKSLGCYITSSKAKPIDILTFSNAVQNNTAHPNIFLSFGTFDQLQGSNCVGVSGLCGDEDRNGDVIWLGFIYEVNRVAVKVVYAKHPNNHPDLTNFFHPNSSGTVISVANFDNG